MSALFTIVRYVVTGRATWKVRPMMDGTTVKRDESGNLIFPKGTDPDTIVLTVKGIIVKDGAVQFGGKVKTLALPAWKVAQGSFTVNRAENTVSLTVPENVPGRRTGEYILSEDDAAIFEALSN